MTSLTSTNVDSYLRRYQQHLAHATSTPPVVAPEADAVPMKTEPGSMLASSPIATKGVAATAYDVVTGLTNMAFTLYTLMVAYACYDAPSVGTIVVGVIWFWLPIFILWLVVRVLTKAAFWAAK
jgi:hypothetical protein